MNVGLMCTVDLFPVPESAYEPRSPASLSPESSHSTAIHNLDPRTSQHQNLPMTYFPLHPYTSMEPSSSQTPTPPFQIPRRQLMLGTVNPYEIPSDMVYQIGNHYVTESSKLTPALVGEKFTEPTLVDYNGRKALVFVFGVRITLFCQKNVNGHQRTVTVRVVRPQKAICTYTFCSF